MCVTSSFPRWQGDSAAPFVLNLMQDLAKLGWEVTVLCPHFPGAARFEVMENIEIFRFRYMMPESQQTVCYQGGALINIRKNRMELLKIPLLVGLELLHVSLHLWRGKYDVLHSHWLIPQGFVGAIAARCLRVPHVVTIHGSDVLALQSRALLPFKRFALRSAQGVTVNSSATRSAAANLVEDAVEFDEIPMGISIVAVGDKDVAQLRSQLSPDGDPIILFVGRLVEEKGVSDLLFALAELGKQGLLFRAVIVGDGQDREKFEAIARDKDIKDQTRFEGWVEKDDVPTYMAAADIFVGPSHIEAQGLVFAEALCGRTAVVATKVGGIPDVIIHEETGLLVDVGSPEQIAAAIVRLLDDPDFAGDMTGRGYQRVMEGFGRQTSAQSFSSLFDRLLS